MPMRKVVVHIGAPKTGTTYLQERLAANASGLARHGVLMPTNNPLVSPTLFQFRAALDLLERTWGEPGHSAGAWDVFVRKAKRWRGTVILSHEILAPAKAQYVAKLKQDLDVGRSTELHVVYSARDFARQLPAAWQESLKQGGRRSFTSFLDLQHERRGWFVKAFDLPKVLNTWSAGLPPEQVHLVTVPRRAEVPRDELWLRFCRVFGIDPAWAPVDTEHVNVSLDVAEARVLRRLNRQLPKDVRESPQYDHLIRVLLAEGRLSQRTSGKIEIPPEMGPWVEEETGRWIDWVEASGIDVVGDLDDLRARPSTSPQWIDPDKPYPRRELAAAIDALALMTEVASRRLDPSQRLVAKVKRNTRKVLSR